MSAVCCIGRRMMLTVLQKASRLSLSQRALMKNKETIHKSVYVSPLREVMLHVWVSQIAPLSLYMSLGFSPRVYLPHYYDSQTVSAGLELTLSLPYTPIESIYHQVISDKGMHALF